MKFNSAITAIYEKTLKKIRIKVDPLHANAENFESVDGYEGYILAECEDSLKLVVMKPGNPVVDIPRDALVEPTMFEKFKGFVELKLGLTMDSMSPIKPYAAKSFEDLEKALAGDGFENKDIAKFYREFLETYDANN